MTPIKLKFDKNNGANTPFGRYRVSGESRRWVFILHYELSDIYRTKADAVAAAQRDFEERLGRCYE